MIVNKPSGIAVHGGSGVSHGFIEILRASRPDAPFLELAHRLERETSGCLMLAKRRSALRRLQELQRAGRITKRYLALLSGHIERTTWRADAPPDAHVRYIRNLWSQLQPFTYGFYTVEVDDGHDSRQMNQNYQGNYARLAEIKKRYDPDNLFHVNQNIEPAG